MIFLNRALVWVAAACLLSLAPAAMAQSNPDFVTGQVPTAAQWNSYFSGKLDYNANGCAVSAGCTGNNTLTAHGLVVGEGSNPVDVVSPGTAGFFLVSAGGGADPLWQQLITGTPSAGDCVKWLSTTTIGDAGAACGGGGGSSPATPSGSPQYNNLGAFGAMVGFAYSGGATDTLTGPDGTTWKTSGLQIASSANFVLGANSQILQASTPLIFSPTSNSTCAANGAGGASWFVGGDGAVCSHATSGATDNLAFGTIVFQALTSGCCNTMMGSENARNLTSGSYNTGIGFEADHFVTTGIQNSAFGGSALNQLTTGNDNTGLGFNAGSGIGTGSTNLCIQGSCGASAAVSGSNNVMLGTNFNTLTTGSSNIVVGIPGSSAGQGIATGNYNVWIGGQGTTLSDQSNSVSLTDGQGNPVLQFLVANGYTRFWHSSRTIVTGGAFAGLTATTVSGLATADPSPATGDRAFVTDAAACTFGSAPTGGSSTKCPVFYNGSAWIAG